MQPIQPVYSHSWARHFLSRLFKSLSCSAIFIPITRYRTFHVIVDLSSLSAQLMLITGTPPSKINEGFNGRGEGPKSMYIVQCTSREEMGGGWDLFTQIEPN